MDLNKKIDEQKNIVENLNKDINHILIENKVLINENWITNTLWEIGKLIVGGVPRYVGQKVIGKGVEELIIDPIQNSIDIKNDEVESKEEELSAEGLTKEEEQQIQSDIDGLKKDIEELKNSLKNIESDLEDSGDVNTSYKEITVDFNGKYELDIPDLKSPEYKHTMEGRRYFEVLSHNESNKTFDLKMKRLSGGKKWPNDLKLRLEYKNLKVGSKQDSVDAFLIYSKYSSSDYGLEGNVESVKYEFIKIVEKK
jgi:hypothetical protein